MTRALVDRCKIHASLWRALAHLGVAPAAVLSQAGLPRALYLNTQRLFTTAELFAIWEAIDTLAARPGFGIDIVKAMDTTGHQPAFLAACYATDYRDGIRRLDRFKRFGSCEHFRFEAHADHWAAVSKDWPCARGAAPAVAIDVTFVFLVELGRRGTGWHLAPARVELARPAPVQDRLAHYFDCPVRYGAPRDRLVLHAHDLDRPFPSGHAELLGMLTPPLLAAVSDVDARASFGDRVAALMKKTMASGRPEAARIARDLGMSVRTLQRRIAAEGTSYRALLATARHELARELLSDAQLSIDDIACLLGYHEIGSFYRAFKRRHGMTPSRWRIDHTAR